MARGRFKGWKSEKSVSVMSAENQALYREFVLAVKKAKETGEELPEPPKYFPEEGVAQDEKISEPGREWWEENPTDGDCQETTFHHCSREGFCIIESNEPFWVRRVQEMRDKWPELVIYLDGYCDGTVRVKIPYKFMKKIKISKRTVSDEQRKRMSELGKSRRKREEETEEEPEELEVLDMKEDYSGESRWADGDEDEDEEFEVDENGGIELPF